MPRCASIVATSTGMEGLAREPRAKRRNLIDGSNVDRLDFELVGPTLAKGV